VPSTSVDYGGDVGASIPRTERERQRFRAVRSSQDDGGVWCGSARAVNGHCAGLFHVKQREEGRIRFHVKHRLDGRRS
jgi:hypothetical protein